MARSLLSGATRSGMRRGLTAVAATALGSGLLVAASTQAHAASGCSVTYSANSWNTGFTASLSVTNLGDALNGWTLEFDYSGNQKISSAWGATYSQSGQHVTLKNQDWNKQLASNATVSPGFQASYSGTNSDPTSFKLNGAVCNGSSDPDPTDPDPTDPDPTDPGTPGTHVDNPYAGNKGYVNPEWSEKAKKDGGSAIANQPTAVWLDRIAAIEGTDSSSSNGKMGLQDHLDEALEQGAAYAQFVIYNLPGRDCAALASNGELAADEIERYKKEYIDPIAKIQKDPKYADLRIINIVEIDSLPNLVTNVAGRDTETDNCNTMKANGNYQKGISYALTELKGTNVYNYIDAGHHGWIGWDDNLKSSAQLFLDTAKMSTRGVKAVDGFIVNTANYGATKEPFITVTEQSRPTKWIDWNRYVDESSFAKAIRTQLVSIGFDSKIGMLIDTSRNGWGGSKRPTKASTSSNIETFVEESRIDRRIHLGNWCNQSGAGLGERPKAAPESGIDAYVWIKPPGESDGSSKLIPNDEGKGFDGMCDPKYEGNPRNVNNMSGALPDAPISGAWFSAQFKELMANAYPKL